MREYGQIQCKFWQKAAEEEWSADAMLLGCYLLSGPHSNGIGCYRLPDGYICDDLRWDAERVSKGFDELFRNGFCNRFGTVVLMPNYLRFNPVSNGNVAKARAIEFESIPNEAAKCAAARALLEFGNHWDNGFINRLETLSKGFVKQERNQPREERKEEQQGASPDGDAPPRLDPIPYQRIIDGYNAAMTNLPKVQVPTAARKNAIRVVWNSDERYRSEAFWQAYWAECAAESFTNGTGPYGKGHENWRPDFDYLIKGRTVTRMFERAMDRLERER